MLSEQWCRFSFQIKMIVCTTPTKKTTTKKPKNKSYKVKKKKTPIFDFISIQAFLQTGLGCTEPFEKAGFVASYPQIHSETSFQG